MAKKQSGAKKTSVVQPLLPYYNKGVIRNGGTKWLIQKYVPATSNNGTDTLLHATVETLAQLDSLYNHYGFNGATLNYTGIGDYRTKAIKGEQ